MSLTDDFLPYKYTVDGLGDIKAMDQDKWTEMATTLKGYVQRDNLTPAASGSTDGNGSLSFTVKPGLYLVIGYRTSTDAYTYTAAPFMVFLPGEDIENKQWVYYVTVSPKFEKDKNRPDKEDEYVTRKVLKIWDDEGYEMIRPEGAVVQLLRDGKVYDTQSLNKDNNWRYTWDKLDDDFEWEVIEKELEGYTVSVSRSGSTYTVTNRYVVPIIGTNLPVQKRITGDNPNTNTKFTFVMKANDSSCPMPESSNGPVREIAINGAGTGEFGEITFTKPGTYSYTVTEKNDGADGYTYDDTVYIVTFNVEEKGGSLAVTREIRNGKGQQLSVIEFTNSYKKPDEKLPQTGSLWWPVPLLICAGLVLVMIGVLLRRKYR